MSDNTDWNKLSDPDLERLVGQGVHALDHPPDNVGVAARAAFEMRDLDGQLSQLLLDDSLATVRDGDDDRADLSFSTDQGPGSVSVERRDGAWRVTGVAPGQSSVTIVSTGGATAQAIVDDGGFFDHTLAAGPGEAIRVVIGGRLVTPWLP